ncbi:MAG: hypothetical protein COA84_13475 [Robiginitomaculum sp.]|nr:MAG: hypothetical protein COA84_13475 [Robiginitomaculum sp.]
MIEILETNSVRVSAIAKALCLTAGQDPTDFGDYSDLRRGKQRWEYFIDDAKEDYRKELIEMVIKEVEGVLTEVGEESNISDIVKTTISVLEGRK